MKRLKPILLALLLAACSVAAKPALPSIATITGEDGGYCTAFSVGKNSWVSQGHCKDAVYALGGKPVKVIKDGGDEGLLLLEGIEGKPYRIAKSAPKPGDVVHATGWPYPWVFEHPLTLHGFMVIEDEHLGDEGHEAIYEMGGGHGMSGAPILNADNEVVGVVEGGVTLDGVGGIVYAQPFAEMKEFLKGVK